MGFDRFLFINEFELLFYLLFCLQMFETRTDKEKKKQNCFRWFSTFIGFIAFPLFRFRLGGASSLDDSCDS